MRTSVSTVTPVYSGNEYLYEIVEQIRKLKEKWEIDQAPFIFTEAIFVDDSSVDQSHETLQKLAKEYTWIKVIALSRNYGQHAATVAGICHTSSDWVVTLDEDLQHKPINIIELFRCQAENGADVVYAHPEAAPHGNSWRDKSSKIVKNILAKLSSTPQIKIFNSFRLIRGSIARAAASSSSSQTYLDIAISWFTASYNSVNLPMHDTRFIHKNTSGYGLVKLFKHARRLIISSNVDVASYGLAIGGITTLVAFLLGCFAIIQKLFLPQQIDSVGWSSIIALEAFIGGIIIMILCVLLEYVNVIVVNQLGKPTFFTIDRSSDKLIKSWFQD